MKCGIQKEIHKDVDVLVLSQPYCTPEASNHNYPSRFEGGIDWWYPREVKASYTSTGGIAVENITLQGFTNGNGVLLHYWTEMKQECAPGLYLPCPEWVAGMRVAEALATWDERVEMEDIDDATLRTKILKKWGMGKRPLPALETLWSGYFKSPTEATPIMLDAYGALKKEL